MELIKSRTIGLPEIAKSRRIITSTYYQRAIISYGILACCISTEKWLIIRRKYSVAFSMIMRGSYRDSYLYDLLQQTTKAELEIVIKCVKEPHLARNYFLLLYPGCEGSDSYIDFVIKRFSKFKYSLEEIAKVRPAESTEWLFPKGKKLINEKPLECAHREFKEETGINITSIQDGPLFNSATVAIDGKKYETKSWLITLSEEIEPMLSADNGEVAEIKWAGLDECLKLLNESSKNLLMQAYNLLSR